MVRIISDSFSFFMRKLNKYYTCFTKPVCIVVSLAGLTIFPEISFANPQTPSQALPKMYEKVKEIDQVKIPEIKSELKKVGAPHILGEGIN